MWKENYLNRVEKSIKEIKDVEYYQVNDETFDYVVKAANRLFQEGGLDNISEDKLLKTGGKLLGAYTYLGTKLVGLKAERDIYRQKLEEIEREKSLEYYEESEKITLAKAKAKSEIGELEEMVIQKETEKNIYEHVVDACEKMLSFIQSTIKVKQGERFVSRNINDNV